jgi:Spy/CpxP family protein refolding chaperone
MRKTLITLILGCSLPLAAMAAPAEMPGMMGMGGMESGGRMFKQLDLSPEQQQQMRSLMRKQMSSRHEIVQRYLDKLPEAERQAMQAELDSSRTKTRDEINALLTPEQQKRFAEMQEKMQKHRSNQDMPGM